MTGLKNIRPKELYPSGVYVTPSMFSTQTINQP